MELFSKSAIDCENLGPSKNRLSGDLLPSERGGPKPGSQSVFNPTILPDDPLDGFRLLPKRSPEAHGGEQDSSSRDKAPLES